jgi:membrane protein insertase Oxa1/YidC/SpoIIIJ
MAVYGRWGKFLTGERSDIYKRNVVIDGLVGLLLAVGILFFNNYSDATQKFVQGWGFIIILLTISVGFIYRLAKKQTVWQLRQQELKIGQKEALDILKDLNVGLENGKN